MPEDDDIERLKEERIEDLQEGASPEEQAEERRKQIRQKASQYLTKEAKSRLGNIRAAQPEMASAVEMQIAQLGETGRIEKIDDEQLKDILRSVKKEKESEKNDIKFRR